MKPNELKSRLASPHPPHLFHILPEEVFNARRIPGSKNACIYLVAFDTLVCEAAPERDRSVVLYSVCDGGLEAETAAKRMTSLGYSDVHVLEGGMDAWSSAGFPIEGSGEISAPLPDGTFSVDTEASLLRWTGRNLFNHHEGTLRLSGGQITLDQAELVTAAFEIDMRTIACTDIEEASMSAALINHLMHSDFFDVERHPLARFETTLAEQIPYATEGTPNVRIEGMLTLRGITRSIHFPAVVAVKPDGCSLTAQAQIEVDRTEFGSFYGSGKFFRMLGQHIVNDHFQLHLKIHATKEPV